MGKTKLLSSPVSNPETINVLLTESKTPVAFKRKLDEYMANGCSEQEARKFLLQPIELDLIYEPDNGLFAVEGEALSSSLEIVSPYTKSPIEEDEN